MTQYLQKSSWEIEFEKSEEGKDSKVGRKNIMFTLYLVKREEFKRINQK